MLIAIILGAGIWLKYQDIYSPNIHIIDLSNEYIYIPTGTNYSEFLSIIKNSETIINFNSFKDVADLKSLSKNIYPGKYKLKNNMNNNQLINMFRSGNQSIVRLSFNNIRTKEQFAGIISSQIEADSISILDLLNNVELLENYNLNIENVMTTFIPNTYEFYWNTSATSMFDKMIKENKAFWNSTRIEKANKVGMSQIDISILASIIDEETTKNSEKPTIAGVYINRLRKGIALQADPSIKFALKNFLKKRITTKDLSVNSPYNTYKYRGVPPGPIRIPSISSIEAVLNYENHSYYYFCAKEDFSGYHVFAKTLRQHNQNARKYHNSLNRNRIYR